MPKALCDSALRKELVAEELKMRDGQLALPTKPGLGIELDFEAVERFSAESGPATWGRHGRVVG